jgi:hypothetical protein
MLQIVDQVLDIRWFSAHLIDLLYHSGHSFDSFIPSQDTTEQADAVSQRLRETWVLRYCETVMYDESLWQLAASYLYYCPTSGRSYAQSLINKLPIAGQSMIAIFKVLDICDIFNLKAEKRTVQKRVGVAALEKEQFSSAVWWLAEAEEPQHIAALVSFLLQKFISEASSVTARQQWYSQINSIAESNVDSSSHTSLQFLESFRDVLVILERVNLTEGKHSPTLKEDIATALKVIVHIFASGLAPRPSWQFLVEQACALLVRAGKVNILSSNDVLELIHYLEEIDSTYHRTICVNVSQPEFSKASSHVVDTARVVFAKALTRSMQYSST